MDNCHHIRFSKNGACLMYVLRTANFNKKVIRRGEGAEVIFCKLYYPIERYINAHAQEYFFHMN